MDHIAGILSLFLIGAAFLSSCTAPETPKQSVPSPVYLLTE
jgi:hypothetical protein